MSEKSTLDKIRIRVLGEKSETEKKMFLILSACTWLLIIQSSDYATQSIFIIRKENPVQVSEKQDENNHALILWATMVENFPQSVLFSSYFLCQLITGVSLCMLAFFSFYFTSHFNT